MQISQLSLYILVPLICNLRTRSIASRNASQQSQLELQLTSQYMHITAHYLNLDKAQDNLKHDFLSDNAICYQD